MQSHLASLTPLRVKPSAWIRRRLRRLVVDRPVAYMILARSSGRLGLINKSTKLVIEGYPRSGNSFCEAAIRLSQGLDYALAHHTHASAHVLYALQKQIPCAVLYREPLAAAASLATQLPGHFKVDDLFQEYVKFYKPLIHREEVMFVSFDHLISDVAGVLASIEKRFNLGWELDLESDFAHRALELVDNISSIRGTVPLGREPYSLHEDVENRKRREENKKDLERFILARSSPALYSKASHLYERMVTL